MRRKVLHFEDDGTTFTSTTAGVTFDMRDLVSGTAGDDDLGGTIDAPDFQINLNGHVHGF